MLGLFPVQEGLGALESQEVSQLRGGLTNRYDARVEAKSGFVDRECVVAAGQFGYSLTCG